MRGASWRRRAETIQRWLRRLAEDSPDTRHGSWEANDDHLDVLADARIERPVGDARSCEQIRRAAMAASRIIPPRLASGQLARVSGGTEGVSNRAELDDLSFVLITASATPGTFETYSIGMKKFAAFRRGRGSPMWFEPGTSHQEMESELVSFYTFYSLKRNYSYNTMHGYLYAIRKYHEGVGIQIELRSMKSLLAARNGWKRIAGTGLRTIAATSEMVIDAIDNGGLNLNTWDGLMKAFALSYMFIFLKRAGEGLDTGRGGRAHCMTRGDLVGLCGGGDVSPPAGQPVDELLEYQRSGKADQEERGAINNVYADEEGSSGCTVKLYNQVRAMNPAYFAPENDKKFLFTMSDGSLLKTGPLEKLLKDGAERLGFNRDGITLHSLRAGGATAMWHAGYSTYAIQGRGRWRSDASKTYIWEGREHARDVA